MKVFFLEPDIKLQNEIVECLDGYRLKMSIKKVQNEQEFFDEAPYLNTYDLLILNFKNPTDPKNMDFIRENGGLAPILLVLEHNQDPKSLKTIYYLSYDSIIIKDFSPDEIIYSIYKLCDVWNNDIFFLNNCIYFDFKNKMFINKEDKIPFGKKESLLLKYLFLKSPSVLTCEDITSIVYENGIISQERIRSLVKQVRSKLPFNIIKTIKGVGYKILPVIRKNITKLNKIKKRPKESYEN